jgi:DNA-binding protein HU-beta
MTKNDLIRSVFEEFEIPRRQVIEIVDHLFTKIEASLISGDVVRLPLGVFKIRDRAARTARNPATGEPVNVPAKRVLKFLPSKAVKAVVAVKPGAKKKASGKKSMSTKAGVKKTAAKKAVVKEEGCRQKGSGDEEESDLAHALGLGEL